MSYSIIQYHTISGTYDGGGGGKAEKQLSSVFMFPFSEIKIMQLEMTDFFDLEHQTIDVHSFDDSPQRTGVLTKEVFCAILGLKRITKRDITCEELTFVNFSPILDECYVKRLSRKSKSNASSLIKKLITTGSV